jgi:ZIP family zinc transporter
MNEFGLALVYGGLAGLMIPVGGYLASIERIQPRWLEQEFRHSMIAFGGGILIAAVALVLVPQGLALLPLWAGLAAFFAGGAAFALFERLQRRHADANAQFIAMLTDFVPEAVSLGAIIASRSSDAALLALLIGAQNLPEAFNAWREMKARGRHGKRRVMIVFLALAAIGPVAVGVGYLFLSDLPQITGAIMLAAAGGILFLMFQNIAVKAHLEYHQAPSLAALAGFAFGILAEALVGAG